LAAILQLLRKKKHFFPFGLQYKKLDCLFPLSFSSYSSFPFSAIL